MRLFQKIRGWLRPAAGTPEDVAEAKRLEQDNLTIRASQSGRQPYIIPPTPDVLDPDREHR
jgi:hypothetical protein